MTHNRYYLVGAAAHYSGLGECGAPRGFWRDFAGLTLGTYPELVTQRSTVMPRPIFSWPKDREHEVTVDLDLPDVLVAKLGPRERQRADIEWLGIIRGVGGKVGALGRLKWNGVLVEVVHGETMLLRPHVATALRTALHEELRALMHDSD